MSSFTHCPVMLEECLRSLKIENAKRYIDCNLGAGGHSEALLQNGALVLGIEADPVALAQAKTRLSVFGGQTVFVNDNFVNLEKIASANNFTQVDGVLFDLGLSSMQLDEGSGGFSFRIDAPLDMRFGPSSGEETASHIINNYSETALADIFFIYGEEIRSRRIAKVIVSKRPFTSTVPFAQAVVEASGYKGGKIHPATRVFQALRIYVNHELENLQTALKAALELLRPGGRLAVLTYHSLEDRLTKQFMVYESTSCVCPPQMPVCCCDKKKTVRVLPKEMPGMEEIKRNPRARSAKLRVCEKL